ncbi:phage protein Gp27 family protein [Citromicrobium bathyomarinum]|uniref:phage protein Gp27 family protein n=1 Tax=Citromicrobium bathyomarinum TaxID=72174 RepID=UPI00315A146B
MARRPRKPASRRKNTPSSIDKLEPEVRELIAHLRIDKGYTIDEVKRAVEAEIGKERAPSRSALGRHVRQLADVSADLRETQVYAEALAKEAGGKTGTQLLDMNTQLLQANMFKLMLAEKDGEGIQLGPKEAKEFSEALRNVALARKNSLELVEKAEARAAAKATAEAAEKATTAARTKGLSAETVDAIRFAVLGSDS